MAAGTLVVKDASNISQSLSTNQDATNANALVGTTSITDPVTGLKGVVSAIGNADAVALGAAVYGQLVGGPNLLLNAAGTFDRQKEAVGAVGVAAVSTESIKATFSLVVPNYAPYAVATDIFVLPGSATKTLRISKIRISGDATANASLDMYIYKRTAVNTAGTSASVAANIVKHDSTDAAASAVPVTYSVIPTGLGAGNLIRSVARLFLPAAGTPALATEFVEDFSTRNSKGLVLRGVAESLAINLGGQTIPAGTALCITVEFSEE